MIYCQKYSFIGSTFEIQDILKSITDLNNPNDCTIPSNPLEENECGMKWKVVNSFSDGRCYTIEFVKNVTEENPLEIILKFHTNEVSNTLSTHYFIHSFPYTY